MKWREWKWIGGIGGRHNVAPSSMKRKKSSTKIGFCFHSSFAVMRCMQVERFMIAIAPIKQLEKRLSLLQGQASLSARVQDAKRKLQTLRTASNAVRATKKASKSVHCLSSLFPQTLILIQTIIKVLFKKREGRRNVAILLSGGGGEERQESS